MWNRPQSLLSLCFLLLYGAVIPLYAADEPSGTGTGFVVNADGYLLTCFHVVKGAAKVRVSVGGKSYDAAVLSTDEKRDLALLQIPAKGLTPLPLANSNAVEVGQEVRAFGFPLASALGEDLKVTRGTVAGVSMREALKVIQIDAAVNPGNSGGPLVNMAGEVIGITSVKIVASEVEGIGYAISSNEAKPIIEDLIRYGHVIYPWLGVGSRTVNPLLAAAMNLSVDRGALIAEVKADSPAEDAGLRVNDVIIRFGDKEISDVADLVQAIRSNEIGEEVEIVFVRGKDTKTTSARLTERPTS
jgi:serine protease Do